MRKFLNKVVDLFLVPEKMEEKIPTILELIRADLLQWRKVGDFGTMHSFYGENHIVQAVRYRNTSVVFTLKPLDDNEVIEELLSVFPSGPLWGELLTYFSEKYSTAEVCSMRS